MDRALYNRIMKDGFLGYDTTLMLDVVITALLVLIPMLAFSIYQVKVRHRFVLHARMQLALAIVLLLAVAAFEIDVQFVHGGWEQIVNKDPAHPRLTGEALESVRRVLWIHLAFAISTPVLWATTIVLALRRFPRPISPGDHSSTHKTLAWLATLDLVGTSLTGLWFYYAAFVATAA